MPAFPTTALTYGQRRRLPYMSDLITAEASRLPAIYAIKDAREQAEQQEALKEKELTQAVDISALERESAEKIADRQAALDTELAAATRASNEAIAKKNRQLEQMKMEDAKKP